MIKLHRALMAGALFVLTAVPAQAASVVGTLPVNSTGVSASSELSVPGVVVTATNSRVDSPLGAEGYFAGIPDGTTFGNTVLDTANLSSFSFENAAWGKFQATGGVVLSPPGPAGFLNVYLIGVFTPSKPGFDASPASVQITYTGFGNTISGGFTLNAPPSGIIPEPASIAMAGISLAAAGLVRGLRKRSV